MSELKMKKIGRLGISPQMALLHLRWQQIRWELLQQATYSSSNESQGNTAFSEKKTEVAA